jgi:hypothetical protein
MNIGRRTRPYGVTRRPVLRRGTRTVIGWIVRLSDGTTQIEWKRGHAPPKIAGR